MSTSVYNSGTTFTHSCTSALIGFLSRDQLPWDQLSWDQLVTRSTLTRSICHEVNSIFFKLKKGYFECLTKYFWSCWNSFDLVELVQKQHANIPQNSKKVICFEMQFHRLGQRKSYICMLVRLLLSYTLNTIIHKIRHQIRQLKKLVSSMRKGQYSLIVIIYMP